MHCHIEIVSLLQNITCLRKCLCHDRVQHDVRRSYGITGAYHTELKLIAGKCKR